MKDVSMLLLLLLLLNNGLFICNQCSQLVAKSHSNSHQQKCTNRGNSMGSVDLPSSSGPISSYTRDLV